MSDEQLMLQYCNSGDKQAFTEIVSRFEQKIIRYLKGCGRQHADAAELTQDVFLHIIRARHKYTAGRIVSSWIFAIANHLMIDRHRSEKHTRSANCPVVTLTDFSEFDIAAKPPLEPTSDSLLPFIERLPMEQRSLIEAIFFDRLTWREAGQKLGMDQGRTYRQFRAALAQLRYWLTQTGVAAA